MTGPTRCFFSRYHVQPIVIAIPFNIIAGIPGLAPVGGDGELGYDSGQPHISTRILVTASS
jgi:hypothetical protein